MNKEIPLTSNGGLVTAHDLAQYVFWTGDEAGAAQAIDDLIEKGLVSTRKEISISFISLPLTCRISNSIHIRWTGPEPICAEINLFAVHR